MKESINNNTIKEFEPESVLNEDKLNNFLKDNYLNLDIKERSVDVQTLIKSDNKEFVDGYVIANDFNLATETSKVTLSYKEGSNQMLVVKEVTSKQMDELIKLNDWKNTTVEEYLKDKGFKSDNVILPIEIIKKDDKVYRFYEAMDMDLEKYLETHNKFSIKEGSSLILRACKGISDLNDVGVANIDMAPLNIMLTKNNIKLIDLDGASIDKDGNGIFKRNYLGNNRFTSAPELFEERPIFDKTVDVYAASACLFRLITGDWPYNIEKQTRSLPYEEKMAAFKKEHLLGNIIFPESIPTELAQIIKKGMSPEPKQRYKNIKEFMSDLIIFFELDEKIN